jgi:hypothetical protein
MQRPATPSPKSRSIEALMQDLQQRAAEVSRRRDWRDLRDTLRAHLKRVVQIFPHSN